MFMRYLGGGIGHKSTWPTRANKVHDDVLEHNNDPEDGQVDTVPEELNEPEAVTGEGDESNYDEEESDHGNSDEERDYGYGYTRDDRDDEEEDGEKDEDEDLGPEDGEDNWEPDEWEVEGY